MPSFGLVFARLRSSPCHDRFIGERRSQLRAVGREGNQRRALATGWVEALVSPIAGEKTPPIARLQKLGVARLILGPRAMRTALWHLQRVADEWLHEGTYDQMRAGELGCETVNGWFLESPSDRLG